MEIIEQSIGEFFITTDKTKMDIVAIHDFLSKYSGWSDNIPFDKMKISIENSLNFGLFHIMINGNIFLIVEFDIDIVFFHSYNTILIE